jgi:hypothetical protein
MNRFAILWSAAIVMLIASGCHVPLQSYRLQHPAIEVPAATSAPSEPVTLAQKDCVDPHAPICLAFIEVDDMGELFDKGQVDTALRLIRQANDAAKEAPGQADPVVITFIHGWKNNASLQNDNVRGFTAALQEIYKSYAGKHRIIGVYVGWRGNLIQKSFPVSQQFSYFNREATAVRIPGATLSSALTQIATRTHENPRALAIFIGHSFGGLLLERTLSETTASQIAEASIFSQESQTGDDAQEKSEKALAAKFAVDSRADLVIFINPAGAATEAKQMLDFLTYNRYRYRPAQDSSQDAKDAEADRPLFVSLTSTADLATKVALPIGHGLPYLGYKANGSFRALTQEADKKYEISCFDPENRDHQTWALKTKEEGAVAQSSFYLSSAPHMQLLQSHVMLKSVGTDQMRVSSTGQTIRIADPLAIAQCDRDLLNKQGLNVVSTFRLADTQACFAIQERPNRCNGTPYWLMEIDPDVVPDHSTIFTQRFIHFIIDTFFAPNGIPLQRVNPQLTH